MKSQNNVILRFFWEVAAPTKKNSDCLLYFLIITKNFVASSFQSTLSADYFMWNWSTFLLVFWMIPLFTDNQIPRLNTPHGKTRSSEYISSRKHSKGETSYGILGFGSSVRYDIDPAPVSTSFNSRMHLPMTGISKPESTPLTNTGPSGLTAFFSAMILKTDSLPSGFTHTSIVRERLALWIENFWYGSMG